MGPDGRRRFCCDEDLYRIGYDGLHAAEDLARWEGHGPAAPTRELIEVLESQGIDGSTVIDVGAGIGLVHLALLEAGASRAIDVDASREYLAAAREQARRRGLAERVDHRHGDIVELAGELPPADIVTLDSVICCYPYLEPLLLAATAPRPRLLGLTFPDDSWWMRLAMRLYNVRSSLLRLPDHYYIHRFARVDRLLRQEGYVGIHRGGIRRWRVVVYRRAEPATA
jgi:magnesium-protoporphyrin O-methyltransferase